MPHFRHLGTQNSSPSCGGSVSPLLRGDCSLRDGATLILQNIYNLINKGSQEDNNTRLCVCCSLGAHQLCHFCVICARSVWIHGRGAPNLSFFSPSAAILDLSLLAFEGLNALQRRRACGVYSLTLTILHATERSLRLVSFACAPALHAPVLPLFKGADSGESGGCGAVRRCQAHFSSDRQRSVSAVSPRRTAQRVGLADTYGPLGNPPGAQICSTEGALEAFSAIAKPEENKGA